MKIKQEKPSRKISSGQITRMLPHPLNKDIIIATCSQGKVTFINIHDLSIVREYQIFNCYATCMAVIGSSICIGSSNGDLAFMRLDGELTKRIHLYDDVLSSILITDSYIVTTGYNGQVLFLNQGTLEIEHSLDLEVPIWDSILHGNKIYLAGNPSHVLELPSLQAKKLKRLNSFAIFHSKLYAHSDERGLTCLSNNSNSYIPCNFILPLQQTMMIFSEQCITEIKHEQQMEWKCHRIRATQEGGLITSGCAVGRVMVLGDGDGRVSRVELESEGGRSDY